MPGPAERRSIVKKWDEDASLPTTAKLQELLLEHEERLRAHFEKLVDKLFLQQMLSDTTEHAGKISSPVHHPGADRISSKSTKGYQARVPNYVRQMVDGTLTKPAPLGNKVRTGSSINSWSSIEHGERRMKNFWLIYDVSIMLLIFVYACLMGVNLQWTSSTGTEPEWARHAELAFCIVFSLDLMCRVGVERLLFFFGPMRWWNLLDSVLVGMMVVSQITQQSAIQSISGLRTLRLLRVLRVMRLARYFAKWPQFRQLRILVASIGESLKVMVWLVLLAFSIIYIFSLILTEGVWPSCHVETDGQELLCHRFGTLASSMMTLFQILYNGLLWGILWDAMEHWDWFFLVSFLMYVSFSMIILGNMMASFLYSLQKKVSKKEKENLIQSEIESKEEFLQQMSAVFRDFDQNGNGAISWTEFQIALEDQRMHAFLSSLELDISDAIGLFQVLDSDGTGAIEHSEFLFGCLRLRGGAKAMDMVRVQMEQEWMHSALLQMRSTLHDLHRIATLEGRKTVSSDSNLRMDHAFSDGSENEQSEWGVTSFAIPRLIDSSPMLNAELRTQIPAEERAVTLQELKRISSNVMLESRHGWADQRTGERVPTAALNLYHFSYHHILPKTAPPGQLTLTLPWIASGSVSIPRKGQQVHQVNEHAALPNASAFVTHTEVSGNSSDSDGTLTLHLRLTKGRFTSSPDDGIICADDSDLGVPIEVVCQNSFSYKELLSSEPCRPTWYCSHWWGEPIVSFVNCCQRHAHLRHLEDSEATYWVCGYANRQHELELEIGTDDIMASSFYRALQVASGLLLILDKEAKPFSRIWCDYELYAAIMDSDKELDIVTMAAVGRRHQATAQMLSKNMLAGESAVAKSVREQNFPLSLLQHGLQVCLEDGEATVAKDKQTILSAMANHTDLTSEDGRRHLQENLKRANATLHSTFAILAWPQAMQRGLLQDFKKDGELKLPEVLQADAGRQSLELSLAHFQDSCVDSAVKMLASGLPPNLTELRLSFEGCNRITDAGLSSLGSRFGSHLKLLYLDFIGCSKLTDTGLIAVASSLPAGLEELELHFAGCTGIGSAGVNSLRAKLPRGLQSFNATFKGTGINKNFSTKAEFVSG